MSSSCMRVRCALVGLLVIAAATLTESTAAQQKVGLFADLQRLGDLTPPQWRKLESLVGWPLPDNLAIFRGRTPEEVQALLQKVDVPLEIQLPNGELLIRIDVRRGAFGETLVTFKDGATAVLVDGESGAFGHIVSGDRFFAVNGLGDGKTAITELFYKDAIDHEDPDETPYGPNPPIINTSCSSDSELRILFLASKDSGADVKAAATIALRTITVALQNSALPWTVTSAGEGTISFTTSASMKADVEALTKTAEALQQQSKTGADIVFLITDHAAGGRARMLLAQRHTAFAIVSNANVNTPKYSFVHEFGHLLGASHQRSQLSSHPDYPQSGAFVGKGWCSAMAASAVCKRRDQIFSNPAVKWPTGSQDKAGDEKTADNASVLRFTLPLVTKFNCVK